MESITCFGTTCNRRYFQADDENACYEEEPVKESLPKEVAERCAGREVVLLNPTKCDAKSLPTVAAPGIIFFRLTNIYQ